MARHRPNDNKRRNMFFNCDLDCVGPQSSFVLILQSPSFVSVSFLFTRYQHYKTFLFLNFIFFFSFLIYILRDNFPANVPKFNIHQTLYFLDYIY